MKRGDLEKKFLHKCAVPHKWPEWPEHFTSEVAPLRNAKSSAEARRKSDIQNKLLQEQITSLQDVKTKVISNLPFKLLVSEEESRVVFLSIDTHVPVPRVVFSFTINEDLSFDLACNGCSVDHKHIKHITVIWGDFGQF